jgi:hypothetical protein
MSNNCGKLDISKMSYDNIVVIGNTAWVKAQVEEKVWFYQGRPVTVIKFDEACYATLCDDLKEIPKGIIGAIDLAGINNPCETPKADNRVDLQPYTTKDCCPQDQVTELGQVWFAYKKSDCGSALVLKLSKQSTMQAQEQGWEQVAGAFTCPTECDLDSIEPNRTIRVYCNDGTAGPPTKPKSARPAMEEEENRNNAAEAQKAVDWTNLNNAGFQGTPVTPWAAVIPMRSNIATYGPYASLNFGTSSGGTNVEVNTDLCPWTFGSVAAMNTAGNAIVASAAIGLTKSETGTITVPGLPISDFSTLGVALGGAGPTLSSMNFTYGSGGITTSYQFQTYTPKFGGLSRHIIDRIKLVSKYRTDMIRFLRNQQATQNKIGNKIQRIVKRGLAQGIQLLPARNRPCLNRLLIADMYDWQGDGSGENAKYGQRTVVGSSKLYDSISEMTSGSNFSGKAFMSLDGLFGPVSVSGDGKLPRYASYSNVAERQSLPKNPHPPILVNGQYEANIKINRDYLNPLTNRVNSNNHHHTGNGMGHGIDLVGHGTDVPVSGLIRAFYKEDAPDKYPNDYRFLGMRGPIVLHSWGYDLQGKPIPNEADDENNTKQGTFQSSSLKDKFLKDWLQKPATWPVAPVDLRFDRDRGVWVSPQSTRIIKAVLDTKLYASGTCQATITTNGDLYDANGSPITTGKITVTENLGATYESGCNVYVYFDTASKQYIILESGPCSDNDNECDCPPPPSGTGCAPTGVIPWILDMVDLKAIPNWDKTKTQVLIHNSGCLEWMDTTACPPSSSSSSSS